MADNRIQDRRRAGFDGDSASGLVSDVLGHATGLVRKEIDLLRAELQQEITKAATAVGLAAGAVLLALVTLNVLAAALVAWLTQAGLDDGWSALIVGGVLGLIAIALATKGGNDLKLASLAPTRTARNVERDVEALKESSRG